MIMHYDTDMINELQTLEEIEKTYTNEWVLIIECETDDTSNKIKRGRVVAHGKKRDVYEQAKKYPGKIGIRYTGKLPKDVGVMF